MNDKYSDSGDISVSQHTESRAQIPPKEPKLLTKYSPVLLAARASCSKDIDAH